MQSRKRQRIAEVNSADASWKRLYQLAGVCALLIFLVALADIVTMFFEGEAMTPGSVNAVGWFTLFQSKRFLALRNLGLLNIVNTILELPLFLALYRVHRRADRAFAALALVLLAVGTSVYISRNTVFSMHALSVQYAAAAEPQKAALAVAGQALLGLGEDLTAGMFMGFFLTELAGLVMAVVMLRGRIFGGWAAWIGIVGFGCLLAFNILAAFAPATYGVVVWAGTVGGLAAMAWYVLVARRLFRLAAA
jgi:hypothetical protein